MSQLIRLNMNVESREHPDVPDTGLYRVVDLWSGWCHSEYDNSGRDLAYRTASEIQTAGYDMVKVAHRLHRILDAHGERLQLGDIRIQHVRLTDQFKALIQVSRIGQVVDVMEMNGLLIHNVYLQLEGEQVYYHVKGRVYAPDIFGA